MLLDCWFTYLLDDAGSAAQKPRAMNKVKNAAKSLTRLLDRLMVLMMARGFEACYKE